MLATVQAIVHLSQSDTPDGLKTAIAGRISALANVQAISAQSRGIGAKLYSLLTQELKPYCDGQEARARLHGEDLMLEPDTAQPIALTLHELATNSAKYGAFSVAEGYVEVEWSHMTDGSLVLRWTERGGPPPVSRPTRRGFDSRMTERMIESLNGKLHFDWQAEGLRCEIIVPM